MASAEDAQRVSTPPNGGADRLNPKKPLPAVPPKPKRHERARSAGGELVYGSAEESHHDSASEIDAYRNKILAELLSTERPCRYLMRADVIKFLKSAPEDVITVKQVARLASNTDMLLNFHRSGLLPQLENLIGRKGQDVNVGSVIISFMPFLKATYAQFVNNYSFAVCALKELVASARFMAFISANWKPDGQGGSSFESYVDLRLITPVQRIPRYELLLKDLLRHTAKNHHEFATLNEAYIKVKEVAEFVNEKKAEAERMQQLLSLQSSLREDQHRQSLVLAQPGRFLLSETRVLVHRSQKSRSTGEMALSATSAITLGAIHSPSAPAEGKIIMFNDCVLVARNKASSGAERLTFSALLYVKPLVVQDLGGLDFTLHAEKDALRSSIVKEGKTLFRFSAQNEVQKKQLLDAIRDAKALLTQKEVQAKNQMRPRLHLAIRQGDMTAIQEAVKADPHCVNAVDRKGLTALHAAVKKRDQEIAKFLLAQGTPYSDVLVLSDAGANVKAMAHDGLTPVDLATKLGDEGMLSVLQPKPTRAAKQEEGGLISGAAAVGSAVGTVVGKGLFAPLRMFKKEDSNSSLQNPKREPSASAELSASQPAPTPANGEDPSPEKGGDLLKKDGSRRSLLSIPILGRSDKENKSKDKDKEPPPSPTTASPLHLSTSSPSVLSDEDRMKAMTQRIADIELHMVALAQEKSALQAELQRLQASQPQQPPQ